MFAKYKIIGFIVLLFLFAVPTQSQAQSSVISCSVIDKPPVSTLATAPATQTEVPAMVKLGLPGPEHAFLAQLAGSWDVVSVSYIGAGKPDKPVTDTTVTSCKRLIAGGRFLEDETVGTVGGAPYYRRGMLGYNTMDHQYEWVTVDGLNANMMYYVGTRTAANDTINVNGKFTDQGLLGDTMIGKSIGMRTEMHIDSADQHTFRLYFTPPGQPEMLASEMKFTRHK